MSSVPITSQASVKVSHLHPLFGHLEHGPTVLRVAHEPPDIIPGRFLLLNWLLPALLSYIVDIFVKFVLQRPLRRNLFSGHQAVRNIDEVDSFINSNVILRGN